MNHLLPLQLFDVFQEEQRWLPFRAPKLLPLLHQILTNGFGTEDVLCHVYHVSSGVHDHHRNNGEFALFALYLIINDRHCPHSYF